MLKTIKAEPLEEGMVFNGIDGVWNVASASRSTSRVAAERAEREGVAGRLRAQMVLLSSEGSSIALAASAPPHYKFGRYQLCVIERTLLVDDQPAKLGARAFDLLWALLRERHRVVGKSELLDLVWPGVVVEEINLQVQISALRKIVGPETIVTIPGRGYRFAARLVDPDASTAPAKRPVLIPIPHDPMLSAAPTPLLGREADMGALLHFLRGHSLVTVLGAGGMGKTTLALAAARSERVAGRDVAWVELAAVSDIAQVPARLARVLQIRLEGSENPLDTLVAALSGRDILLVLDGAEHLAAALAPLVNTLRAAVTGLSFLLTSQVALKVEGERILRLGPLDIPDSEVDALEAQAYGAVALFVEQVQAAARHFTLTDHDVPAIVRICQRLDGMPLAIKLAASRLPMLGIGGVEARLNDRFRLLHTSGSGVPPRHTALRATLDWSHGLLSSDEQRVFRRLGIFPASFSLDMAGEVASSERLDAWDVVDILESLVERSFVAVLAGEQPRYCLLESARAYARGRLDETGEYPMLAHRHAHAVMAMAARAQAHLLFMPDQRWMDMYLSELDNIRVAMDWAQAYEPEVAVEIASCTGFFFGLAALQPEGRQRLATCEGFITSASAPLLVARYWVMRTYQQTGMADGRPEFADRALALCRATGDDVGSYVALSFSIGRRCGDSAAAALDEKLAELRRLERPEWPAKLKSLGVWARCTALQTTGRVAESLEFLSMALPMVRECGSMHVEVALLTAQASGLLAEGRLQEATQLTEEVLQAPHAWGGADLLEMRGMHAACLTMQGDLPLARRATQRFVEQSYARSWMWCDQFLDALALLAAQEHQPRIAGCLVGYSSVRYHSSGVRAPHAARCHALVTDMVRTQVGEVASQAYFAEGRAMLEDAVSALKRRYFFGGVDPRGTFKNA